ncbi:cytidylyltransferase domain-containing protein [Chloroflexota bacterium]
MKVVAIIPARGGSKGIPRKNLKPLAGKPLIAHTIEHALLAQQVNCTIVSTDDDEIATVARQYGAEVPFIRPSEISQDFSTDLEVFTHALKWFAENECYIPDICIHLRPTYPIRKVGDIDKVVQILLDNPTIDSVRSVTPAPTTPMKMWLLEKDGLLSPVVKTDIKEAYNLPRQLLPQAYIQNACIDAVWAKVITEMQSMTGTRIFGYVMDDNFDIDTESQLQEVAKYLTQGIDDSIEKQNRGFILSESKRLCFDIDGIIATLIPSNRYDLAEPQPDNIRIINSLYKQGHQIILFTARGSATGINWVEITRRQLSAWGVKYHELLFGKPPADYYVDDKLLSIEQLQTFLRLE